MPIAPGIVCQQAHTEIVKSILQFESKANYHHTGDHSFVTGVDRLKSHAYYLPESNQQAYTIPLHLLPSIDFQPILYENMKCFLMYQDMFTAMWAIKRNP
jgi:hypothetical protein